jgi:hypothetical protein
MIFTKRLLHTWEVARIRYALLTGLVLCSANYAIELLLDRFGTTGSKTILNDLAIGILGALAVFFFLSASHEKQKFDSAKQRMALISELNSRIREAFGVVAASALSDDRFARLRGIDEATDHIDSILSEFLVSREHRVRRSEEQKSLEIQN